MTEPEKKKRRDEPPRPQFPLENSRDPKKRKKRESMTIGVKKRSRFTERLTVRMDPATKKMLKTFTAKSGITQCQLIHALLSAYFYGVGDKLDLDVKSPTINLTIERAVQRVRRYKREYDVDVTTEVVGSRESCALCGERSVAVMFNYPSRDECISTYLCRLHWREREGRKDFDGFRLL